MYAVKEVFATLQGEGKIRPLVVDQPTWPGWHPRARRITIAWAPVEAPPVPGYEKARVRAAARRKRLGVAR